MNEITRVGVDLAKNVIQVHAVDAAGKAVTNRPLPRRKFVAWCVATLPAGCLVAMEASSSAHHWARKLVALGLDARIIAARLVSPYRLQGTSGKNDANDAAAICEAASRPTMRFVPIKTVSQQGMLCVHRLREGLKEERGACINRIRGLLAEFGLVVAQSPKALSECLSEMIEDAENDLPGVARLVIERARSQWQEIDAHIQWYSGSSGLENTALFKAPTSISAGAAPCDGRSDLRCAGGSQRVCSRIARLDDSRDSFIACAMDAPHDRPAAWMTFKYT